MAEGRGILNDSNQNNSLQSTISSLKSQVSSLQPTPYQIVNNPKDFDTYFKQMATDGLEGLMAKKLDAPYRAGARDFTWVKYKVGMQTHMADTVDAIIMGYFKGQGKWAKFGLGKILIGLPQGDQILSLSKVGSGLSEETIKELVKRLNAIKTDKQPTNYQVDKNLIPDVWVKPQQIIEIRADSISKSPIYTAGLSLRFPRIIRFRDDKSIEDATSISELKTIAGGK
jgi:DNA ligase-1